MEYLLEMNQKIDLFYVKFLKYMFVSVSMNKVMCYLRFFFQEQVYT